MSELIEITQTLRDPDNFKSDVSAATALVAQHFRKKYLDPMSKIYAEHRAKCLQEPGPQVALLQACKPFIKDTSSIDRMISGISSYTALTEILRDFSVDADKMNERNGKKNSGKSVQAPLIKAQGIEGDNSVHTDGVYDIDRECIRASSNPSGGNDLSLLLLAALLYGIRK